MLTRIETEASRHHKLPEAVLVPSTVAARTPISALLTRVLLTRVLVGKHDRHRGQRRAVRLRRLAADLLRQAARHRRRRARPPDALIIDKQSGRFTDGVEVCRLDYEGKFFKSRGPVTVPRSPQGHPVLIQAGQSGRGRQFAARWAELIFAVFPKLAVG